MIDAPIFRQGVFDSFRYIIYQVNVQQLNHYYRFPGVLVADLRLSCPDKTSLVILKTNRGYYYCSLSNRPVLENLQTSDINQVFRKALFYLHKDCALGYFPKKIPDNIMGIRQARFYNWLQKPTHQWYNPTVMGSYLAKAGCFATRTENGVLYRASRHELKGYKKTTIHFEPMQILKILLTMAFCSFDCVVYQDGNETYRRYHIADLFKVEL